MHIVSRFYSFFRDYSLYRFYKVYKIYKREPTMINEETARATAKLAALCAKAEHCTGEMDKKLRQWGISAEDRQTVIDYLVTNHYVDDSRYTEAFVEDKIRFNQWGRRKIEQALYAKGVSADVYTPVLDRVPDDLEWPDDEDVPTLPDEG